MRGDEAAGPRPDLPPHARGPGPGARSGAGPVRGARRRTGAGAAQAGVAGPSTAAEVAGSVSAPSRTAVPSGSQASRTGNAARPLAERHRALGVGEVDHGAVAPRARGPCLHVVLDLDRVEAAVGRSGARRRSAISARYQASSRRAAGCARSAQSSRERSNVAGACGSGTSSRSQPNAANSRAPALAAPRRPSSGSAWSVKYCHGVDGAPLLAHEQHRHERRGQHAAPRRSRAGRATAGARAGRPARGCRPGRGSAASRRTASRACGRVDRPAVRAAAVRRVAAVVDERAASSALASARERGRSRRSSPARSPVSAACSAWWKSSLHCASSP